jgi:hypothetical protein
MTFDFKDLSLVHKAELDLGMKDADEKIKQYLTAGMTRQRRVNESPPSCRRARERSAHSGKQARRRCLEAWSCLPPLENGRKLSRRLQVGNNTAWSLAWTTRWQASIRHDDRRSRARRNADGDHKSSNWFSTIDGAVCMGTERSGCRAIRRSSNMRTRTAVGTPRRPLVAIVRRPTSKISARRKRRMSGRRAGRVIARRRWDYSAGRALPLSDWTRTAKQRRSL